MPKEREIEELTLNAWPPLETLFFDGWTYWYWPRLLTG